MNIEFSSNYKYKGTAVALNMIDKFIVLLFLLPLSVIAEEGISHVGDVSAVEGRALLYKGGGARSIKLKSTSEGVAVHDLIKAKGGSYAIVSLIDKTRVIIEENSAVRFTGVDMISTESGRVLFDVMKQAKASGITITTPVAVIGVKGTRFLVEVVDDDVNVYLNEGVIDVSSISGEFKRYKDQVKNEFDEYLDSQQKDLEKYKKSMEDEYFEYVNNFELVANSGISISGSDVRDVSIPEYVDDLFEKHQK